jgi:acetylornithine deacetylase/succinyl-diaminopimelate desuccinylase-like protein
MFGHGQYSIANCQFSSSPSGQKLTFQLCRLTSKVTGRMTDTEKLLRELIALPSVNPAFLPRDDTRAGEGRAADFVAVTAARAGLDIHFQKVFPGRSNVLATLSPQGKIKRRLLLAPHLDTVNVVSEKQFVPRSVGGRIYGRGACDAKGSVAAMITALSRLSRTGRRPASTEIIFAGLMDEENAQSGSRALATSGCQADLAIVGEPTRLQIVTAHKGTVWIRLETHGKAAHGSCPHLGQNAVREMARIVELIESEYARHLQQRRHPLLGAPTVNIGFIHGGTQFNIVPAQCVAGADRRTLPGETEASVRAEMHAWLRRHGLRATLTSDKSTDCLPLETDARLPLVQQFLRTARQKKPEGVDYFCDASILAQAGIPSIVFGPGDIAQAHTSDEWIAKKSLEAATALLLKFLRTLP